MSDTSNAARCSCGGLHPPEACPERPPTVFVGPAIAPLSTEIPTTTPAQGGELRVTRSFVPQGPTPAPTTADARARARIESSSRRIALAHTLRQVLWWSIVGLAVLATIQVSVTLLRAPAPGPAPTVVAPPVDGPSRRQLRAEQLVEEGDAWIRRDPARAGQLFRDALTLDPTNAAANFGLGVTLLQDGASAAAVPYLCAAQRTAVDPLRRDVQHLLDERDIDCP